MAELGSVKNIFLVYPSFSGGNHLANLIGLCPGVEPTWLTGEELVTLYTKRNIKPWLSIASRGLVAHYNNPKNEIANINRLYHAKNQLIKQQQDGYINIIQGHHFGFKSLLGNYQYIKELEDIKWLMVEYPSENSLCWKRMQVEKADRNILEHEPGDKDPRHPELYAKLDQIYTWDYTPLKDHTTDTNIISKITSIYDICPEYNGISISPDQYCSYDGFKYLRDTLKGYFGLELPPIADRIHKLWIDMIEYRVLHDTFIKER